MTTRAKTIGAAIATATCAGGASVALRSAPVRMARAKAKRLLTVWKAIAAARPLVHRVRRPMTTAKTPMLMRPGTS